MKTPNVTQAQLLAIATFVVGQAVAWGWLSSSTSQLVVAIASTAIAAAWKISDAIIRHGRAGAKTTSDLTEIVGLVAPILTASKQAPPTG